MQLSSALSQVSLNTFTKFTDLKVLLSPELVADALSQTGVICFPPTNIVDLYDHRWEIELGFGEMKQSLLESQFTRSSNQPELIKQKLWWILLAYSLIRYQMVLMVKSFNEIQPNQLSLPSASMRIIYELTVLAFCSPENIPNIPNQYN